VPVRSRGSVRAIQTISQTSGAFSGTLAGRDNFGWGVESLKDLDGDSIVDLAVGAPNDDDGSTNYGAVYILFLNGSGQVKNHQKISLTGGGFQETSVLDFSTVTEASFGSSLALVPDLDGDGLPELAVAIPYLSVVWLLFLRPDGTVKKQWRITGDEGIFADGLDVQNGLDLFGASIVSLGDFNGDNFADLAVGAPLDNDGKITDAFGHERGALYIIFLGEDEAKGYAKLSATRGGITKESNILPGSEDGGPNFGRSVAWLGNRTIAIGADTDDDKGNPPPPLPSSQFSSTTPPPFALLFCPSPPTLSRT
jgi:hypothetical protein